jgi:CheY-like chemotaxis protein
MAEQANSQIILVADGDVLVRHAIADYLRQCGYVVIEAASTDEAVKVLTEGTPALDAVLCDAECPGTLNAFQFRAWAMDHKQEVQVKLAGSIEAAAAKAAEFCDEGPHLARPYDPRSVVDYVRRVLGGVSSEKQRRPI